MTTSSDTDRGPHLRLRLPSDLLAGVDNAVADGRFASRNAYMRAAVTAFQDGSTTRVSHRVEQHSELLAFSVFLNLAVLRTQITSEEVAVIRTMAEDLFLNGITAPIEVMEALGYTAGTEGGSS